LLAASTSTPPQRVCASLRRFMTLSSEECLLFFH